MEFCIAKEQLMKALKDYFLAIYGSEQDYAKWFTEISNATAGGKMLSANKITTDKINEQYDIPEWFMCATLLNL